MQTALPANLGPTERRHSLLVAGLFLVAAALAVVAPFVQYAAVYGVAAAMGLCLFIPMWIDYVRHRFDAFESLHLVGLLNFTYFGLGAIWSLNDPNVTADDKYLLPFIPLSAFYCLLGYLALLGGYHGPWFRERRLAPVEYVPHSALFIGLPAAIGFLGYMSAAIWSRASWMGISVSWLFSSLAQTSMLFMFAWALIWIQVLGGRATPNQRRLFWFGMLPAAGLIIASNLASKFLVTTIVGVPLIAYWYARRAMPWRLLLVLLLVVIFVVFPFYNNYRNFDARIPVVERIGMTWHLIQSWDSQDYLDESLGKAKARVALINQVAVVVRDVPRWVPYAKGETIFYPMVAYFVPRLIWPDKPPFLLGREFGVTFRVVNMADKKTSIAATVPGELYWNFDVPGIVVGMAVWGIFLRFLYRRYGSTPGLDPARRAIHIVLLVQFALFSGGIAGHTVPIVRTVILLEVFLWFSRRIGLLRPQLSSSISATANT